MGFQEIRAAIERTTAKADRLRPESTLVGEEIRQLEIGQLQFQLAELKKESGRKNQLHWTRICVLAALFVLICVWLYAISKFLWESAEFPEGLERDDFSMTDSVAIALITSTTVNVLGLFVLAARWLFQVQKD